jgi:hypothetical protein
MTTEKVMKWNNKLLVFNEKLIRPCAITPPSYPTDGLTMEMLFENNANETYGHNGTWSGTETYVTGISGKAASFSDGSHIVSDTYYNSITVDRNAFTHVCWIYTTSLSAQQIVFDSFTTNTYYGQNNHSVQISTSGQIIIAGDSYGVGYRNITSTAGDIAINTWYMLASGYNGSRTWLKIYRVGTGLIRDIGTDYTYSTHSTTTVWIGKTPWSSGIYMTGYVDQFRLYNRTLSDAEIAQLWNNGNGI